MRAVGLFLLLLSSGVLAQATTCVDCASALLPDGATAAVAGAAESAAEIAAALDESYCQQLKGCGWGECGPALANQCGLTRTEAWTIYHYMGSGYRNMNTQLWGQQSSEACTAVIHKLHEALERLPRFQGVVYRGTSLPAGVRDQHVVGSDVTYPAFTSSSTDGRVADMFGTSGDNGGDIFTIISASARPIMTLQRGESEMLFAAGTSFHVLRRTEAANKIYRYIMVEVLPGEAIKAKQKRYKAALEQGIALDNIRRAQLKAAQEGASNESSGTNFYWACPTDGTAIPATITAAGSAP